MATDSTNLPQGELNTDAGTDTAGSELEFGSVQLAQVTADSGQPVQLPQGQQVVLIPVQPGQTLTLPTDSPNGLLAKVGPEGNLAIVVDGRTIIFQGYVQANDQSPVRLVTSDGDLIDVADVVAATDPSLDIQTAAGPATGAQGDTLGNGIFTPFDAGPPLGGLNAIGVLDPTALQYILIDDEQREFVDDEDTGPTNIDITFDILGGIVNEDDLPADANAPQDFQAFKLVVKDQGNDGTGNDPFDTKDREDQPGDEDGVDDNGSGVDPDREPLTAQAFVKVTFGDDIPGTLWVDETKLPTGLTSEGEPIVYEVLPPSGGQGNGIVAFVDNNGDGHFDESDGDRIVFDIKVLQDKSDSEFTIDFTLYDNIDNVVPDVNDDGKADLLGGIEEILGLPVNLTAKDSDGTSLSKVMDLGVQDDIPFFGEVVINDGEEGGITITIENRDADIEHDESKGVQNSSDDQYYGDAKDWVQPATQKVIDAGFDLPYGDSEGALWPKGIAQTQVIASFGADQSTQEHWKKADDASARNSVFGELQDRTNADGDGIDNGENERPFELFMTVAGTGGAPAEDDLDTLAVEGNLTIQDQLTNATVTWDGGEILNVFIRQIDAQTIIGYVIPEGQPAPEAREVEGFHGENGEQAVFVLTIDDNGVMTFVQYHQLNHPDFPDNHDEEFEIADANGDPLIHVRISDFDGDHAQQPVKLVVEDDGPKFKDVCFTHGNGTVDEDLLPGGNLGLDFAPGDESFFDGTSTSGTINFSIGVDKPGTLSFGGLVITDQAGNPIDITALKTADGNGVELLPVSGPDGDGVVTWQAVEIGTGDPVFKMTLDTSGGDMGDFKFTLQQALSHPFTDSDLNNDDIPQSRYEDNLNFAFNVVATDIDKDTGQGTINIVVDDDAPKAIDDFDIVTEGKTGDAWNFASGNVVTGKDAVLLGKDANGFPFDGFADGPGADRPYTISKLAHDGDTYTLSNDGLTVLKNGAPLNGTTETFDGKILKIPTDEGGTFEIVMISATQSEVGEYRYTVPENADHDIDYHVGPEDAAATLTDAFDTVPEWESAFSAGGITLEGFRGGAPENLDIKLVNVPNGGPSYRGIGVDNGIDGAEVDLNGPEYLKLTIENSAFPGGVNNATLLLGALFDGVNFDAGNQEILKWEIWNNGVLVNSGQILGDLDGLVTLDIDSASKFDEIRLYPVDNGAGGGGNNSDFLLLNVEICKPLDKFVEEFDYTLRDSDGDESTATLHVGVEDTEPKIRHGDTEIRFLVDEDGIVNGNDNHDLDDAEENHSAPNAAQDDGIHIGKINFTPGFDPVKIELSVGNGGDTGLDTVDGKNVLAAWDAATSTLIGYIEGTDPANTANRVFTMKIDNPQTGEFTFTLLKPVEHPDFDPNESGDDENNPDLSFFVNIQIEDQDCDTIFAKAKITIDDDMPVITQQSGNFTLYVDESLDGNSTPNNAGDHPHNPGTRIEDDEDGAGLPGVLTGLGSVIGASKAGASALFSYSAGADGLQSAVYSFGFTPGADTGLIDSQSNSAVVWVQNGAVLEGRSAIGNHLVIALTINPGTGEVAMAQYRAINHGGEESAPGNHDEVLALGGGKLSVILTVTDKDDDTVSSSVDLGGRIKFDDDGPKADIDKKEHGDNQVLHDESAGLQNDDQPNGSLPGVFSAAGLIGWARSGDPVVTTSDSSYGTDGPGTTVLALKADFEGVNSGLDDTATGNDILLYTLPDGTVQGKVAGTGELAFHISINANGTVDVAQYRAIEHPNPNDDDEEVGISNSALQAVVTVTDKDGDSDTDSVDIGSRVRFDDDAPHADIEKASGAQIVLDESVDPASGPYADPNANDEAGNVPGDIAYAKVAGNLLFIDNSSFGTDGPGTKTYSLAISGNFTNTGLDDVATGQDIRLVQIDSNTVEGRVGFSSTVAFRIDIDTSNGEVTISQFRAIEHDNAGDSAATHDESGSPEIMDQNKLFLRQTVTDGDHDSDSDEIDLGKLIKFEDDGPVAVDDVDSVDEDSGAYAIGNVYDGDGNTSFGNDANGTDGNKDDIGSDGFKSLQWKDPASGSGFDGNGNVVGLYGTLYVQTDGDYKYVLNEDHPDLDDLDDGEVLYDTFSYVITDKDGDTSTAELKITINGKTDSVPPSAEDATAFVDEDGLPTGLGDSAPGDDNADSPPDTVAGEAVFHDLTLPVNWNGFPGTISLTAGVWAGLLTIDGHAIEVDPASTSTLLIGRDATTLEKVFEVEILDQLTGEYEVRLLKALQHPDSNNNPADDATDFGAGAYEDNLIIPVNVHYANVAGSIDRVLSIDVDDDAPKWQSATWDPLLDDEGAPLPGYTGIEGASAGTDFPGANVSSFIHTVFAGGADGLHSIVPDLSQMASLNSALRATDGTADGAPIAFAFEGTDLVARISDATSPLDGHEVLRLHPEATLGDFTLTQSNPIFHVGQGEQHVTLQVALKAIDNDGDVGPLPTFNILINDDMPDLTNVTITIDGDGKLIHDETAGVDGDADDVAARPATLDGFEDDHPGLGAVGYAHSVLNLAVSGVPSLAGAYGADGQGTDPVLKLTKADGGDFDGEQSNLVDTATDDPIYLFTEIVDGEPVVVGRVGAGGPDDNGPIAFVLRLDGDTGAFDLGQYRAIKHPLTGNDGVNHDDAVTLLNNGGTSGLLNVTLTITDGDGDTVSKTVPFDGFQGNPAVVFQDDGPTANDDPVNATPGANGTADIVFIVDVSGSMTNGGGSVVVPGVPDFDDNRLGLARYSMRELLLAHPEILNVQFVKFDDGVSSTLWMTRADALTYIGSGPGDGNFAGGGRTNYDIALAEAMDVYDSNARPAGAADQTLVYFLSDGAPNENDDPGITTEGTGADEVSIAEWEAFVTNPANDITNVFALGLGGSVNAGNLAPISFPNNDDNAPAGEDNVVVIPDANLTQLTQTLDDLLGNVLTPVSGDVTDNDTAGADDFGDSKLVSVTYNAVDYVFGPGNTQYIIDLGVGRGSLKIEDDGEYTYTPPAGGVDGTPFFVEYTIRDGDGDTDTAKILIDLAAPPQTDLNGAVVGDDVNVVFTEQTPQLIAPDATITAETANLASMTVTLTNRPDGNGVESLSIPGALPGGLLASYTAATGVLLITGPGALADFQAVLQSIVYNNTSDAPNLAPRSVTVVVNDGAIDSVPNTSTITVFPVNDGPDAVAPVGPYAIAEQINLPLHGTGLSISDVDAGSGIVTVTLSVDFGILTVSGGNSGVDSVVGSGTNSVVVTGTVIEINNLLQDVGTGTIVFKADSDNPPASAQLTLHVNDEGNTGGGDLTDSAIVTINITNTPDAPTTNAGSGSGNEDAASIAVSLSGNDADGTVASFRITSLPANGTLFADALLTNVITVNEIVSAIANAATVYFVPNPNFNGSPTFQYAAIDNDGLQDATPAIATITVASAVDPTVANDDSIITAINNDASFLVPAWALLANDSDGDGPLTVSITAFDGGNSFDSVTAGGGNVTVNTDNDFDPGDVADFTYKAADGNSSDTALVTVTAVGNGNITGTDNGEIIVDNDNAHTINAGKGNDIVFGNDGNDTINGGDGDDILDGGEGGDTYTGGQGNDTINVGDGNDTVNYTSVLDGTDVITNFDGNAGGGGQDVLNLDALFDSLGTATANRAGRVEITDNGSSVDIRVNADGVGGFELHVATINSTDTISVGSDVLVGTL